MDPSSAVLMEDPTSLDDVPRSCVHSFTGEEIEASLKPLINTQQRDINFTLAFSLDFLLFVLA